jgi:hypothetical protein
LIASLNFPGDCQSLKGPNICGCACRNEKLISACKAGRAVRELNLLIANNRYRKQIRKLFEDIRD